MYGLFIRDLRFRNGTNPSKDMILLREATQITYLPRLVGTLCNVNQTISNKYV